MVSFSNALVHRIILVLLLLSIINLGNCLQKNKKHKNNKKVDKSSGKVRNNFVWKRIRPNLNAKVSKTWLKLDPQTAKDNSKAEEAADEGVNVRASAPNKVIKISPPECGNTENVRIVGGRNAALGAYPWIVVIIRFGQPICAGNLISSRWIVTAGHCFLRNNGTQDLYIRIGTNQSDKGTQVKASRVVIHPRFNVNDMYNSDISLIKTLKPLKFSKNVRPICLPTVSYAEPVAKKLLVAGWGARKFPSKIMPIQLQDLTLDIISAKECVERYKSKNITIYKSQLCTWSKGKDACRGDSGGPAVEYIKGCINPFYLVSFYYQFLPKGKAFLVGIVSYGITCADSFPGIFTKVSYYLQWIQHIIDSDIKNVKPISKLLNVQAQDKYDDHYSDINKKGARISLGGSLSGSTSLKFG